MRVLFSILISENDIIFPLDDQKLSFLYVMRGPNIVTYMSNIFFFSIGFNGLKAWGHIGPIVPSAQ